MVVPGGAGWMFLSQGVPSINLVGIAVIMAPLSSTAVGSSGRTSLKGEVSSGSGIGCYHWEGGQSDVAL